MSSTTPIASKSAIVTRIVSRSRYVGRITATVLLRQMSSLLQIRRRNWSPLHATATTQLWSLFAVGLVFRFAVLGIEGTNDMRAVLGWGDHVRQSGLVAEYHGIYFPVAYLIFGGVS